MIFKSELEPGAELCYVRWAKIYTKPSYENQLPSSTGRAFWISQKHGTNIGMTCSSSVSASLPPT